MDKLQKMSADLLKVAFEAGGHPELLPIENASQAKIAYEAMKKVCWQTPSELATALLFAVENLLFILGEEGDTPIVYRQAWSMSKVLRRNSYLFGDDAETKIREGTGDIQMLVS